MSCRYGILPRSFNHSCTVAYVVNGFALSVMWNWFIVPLGVGCIGIWQAVGMAMIFSLLAKNIKKEKDSDSDDSIGMKVWRMFCGEILAPLIVLFLAWLVHLF